MSMDLVSLSGALMKTVMRKKVLIPTTVVMLLVVAGLFLFGGSNDPAENGAVHIKVTG